MESQTLRSLEQ